jgi:hypothetical protein
VECPDSPPLCPDTGAISGYRELLSRHGFLVSGHESGFYLKSASSFVFPSPVVFCPQLVLLLLASFFCDLALICTASSPHHQGMCIFPPIFVDFRLVCRYDFFFLSRAKICFFGFLSTGYYC